jgi:hypothetical protein
MPIKYSKYLKKFNYSLITTQSAYLELILTFAAIAFFGWFAIRPTLLTIGELVKEIQTKQEILAKLNEKIDALVVADTVYRNSKSKLQFLDQALPSYPQIVEYMAILELLSTETGIQLSDIDFNAYSLDKHTIQQPALVQNQQNRQLSQPGSQSEQIKEWFELGYKISARGTYPQLKEFLRALNQLRKTNLVKQFNFRPETRNQAGSDQLDFQLDGLIIYY